MSFLFRYWTQILSFSAAVLICMSVFSCSSDRAVRKAVAETSAQCVAIQNITKEAEHGLQNNLNSITARLNRSLSDVQPNATGATRKPDAARGAKYAGRDGRFAQYAAIAETYRVKVMACQDFLKAERDHK
jgi:hypothetical protein